MNSYKELIGEFLGTFILVLFGCGSVAVAVLFEGFGSLLEVAIVWGLGVAIAIFSVRNLCPAHLNPAVSLAMYLSKNITLKQFVWFSFSQLLGAFVAGLTLYFAFANGIEQFEALNGIQRGSPGSHHSAMMFGEFFPNPSFESKHSVSHGIAFIMEGLGTFILVFVIYRLTENERQVNNITPLAIGLTVTLIICIVAPFTQAGINPARDFGPRLVAYFAGWKEAAFPAINFSFFTVYIASPFVGALFAFALNSAINRRV